MGTHKTKKITLHYWYCIACISLFFFFFCLFRGINLPYVGYNAWNFTTYSLIAHNYRQFGFIATKFAPIVSVGATVPKAPVYYLHHPQLLSLIESQFFAFFGEDFWVGRLTVILFAIGTVFLLYLIAQTVRGTYYGLIVISIASVIPATSLFGKMIGQEPLVLFFCMAALYNLLRYEKTSKQVYLFFLYVSIVLGTWSDWPMIYFCGILFLYTWYRKKRKLGFAILATAIGNACMFIGYIYWLQGGFADLVTAFTTRSLGTLLTYSYWPLLWFVAITIRLFFYFNPIFIGASFGFLIYVYTHRHLTKERSWNVLICLLGLFGLVHVLLYPEGSFGHPYWIYFFLPFIVFSVAEIIILLSSSRSFFLFVLVFVISVWYLIQIETWKTKEIVSNVFRYELAKHATESLKPFEKIAINSHSVIDYDLFRFPFLHEVVITSATEVVNLPEIRTYIYTCAGTCDVRSVQKLQSKYAYQVTKFSSGEQIIFSLDKKRVNEEVYDTSLQSERSLSVTQLPYKESIVKKIYAFLLQTVRMPQL